MGGKNALQSRAITVADLLLTTRTALSIQPIIAIAMDRFKDTRLEENCARYTLT